VANIVARASSSTSTHGQKGERFDVFGSHDGEVTAVERGDAGDAGDVEAFGNSHDGRVGSAQAEIVSRGQLRHSAHIGQCQLGQVQLTSSEGLQELHFCLRSGPLVEQVTDLGDDGRSDQ
jgi:hypothetical protein